MVNYNFGPPPDGIEVVLDSVEQRGDSVMAQSIYDTRKSGHYGMLDLFGHTDPVESDQLILAQHIFWDNEQQRIRAQGLIIKDHPESLKIFSRLYQANGSEFRDQVGTAETGEQLQKIKKALEVGRVATLAAWEFVTSASNPGTLRLIYPRLLFDHVGGPELARTQTVQDIPVSALDKSVSFALLASAVALHDTLS